MKANNNQKLREASEQVCAFLEPVRKGMVPKGENLLTALIGVKDALAAPPRNCDRFVDELDAQIGFLNEVWIIFVTKDTMRERDKFENWTEEMKSRYAKWLLAEAKGGAK